MSVGTCGTVQRRFSFHQARQLTDRLFDLLRPEAFLVRPIAERHRLLFYLGHLEAFDWNLLRKPLHREPCHPQFDHLFAFGIDPTDSELPSDRPEDWPSLDAVRGYVSQARRLVDDALPHVEEDTLLHIAIEHRLMHAETLCYLMQQLPLSCKVPMNAESSPAPLPSPTAWIRVPAGQATLGRNRHDDGFGWDNEYDEQTVDVSAFMIESDMVTNARFLEFVRAGGYHQRNLWTDAAWQWRTSSNVHHPAFWIADGASFRYRGMTHQPPLPLNWPVYVSHAEASAFALWSDAELPTEAQWHRAAYGTPDGSERSFPWGEELPTALHGNFDFERWDPEPIGSHPAGDSAFGVRDLLGNGWEWTATPFAPLPGYRPFDSYPGYSIDFFDGRHFVLKGASPRTAKCFLRRSFRNWFQPHYPYTYSGFRLVRDAQRSA